MVPLLTARSRRLKIPLVVGEILAGVLAGPSVLGWVTPDRWLDFLATLGLTYLMFLSGLEVDFGALMRAREAGRATRSFRAPLCFYGLTLLLSAGAALGFAAMGLVRNPWVAALAMATTSLGVVLPILKERGLSGSDFGQQLLLAALVADFGTMLLLAGVVALLTGGNVAHVLLISVLFLAFFLLYRLARAVVPRGGWLGELGHATSQLGVRGSFMIIFVFVALAEGLGAEVILGAFLAGALVSLLERGEAEDLRSKLDAIGFGFFIPLFFIMVGVRLEVGAVLGRPDTLVLAGLMLLGLYGIKLLAAQLSLAGPVPHRLASGFLLAPGLSLVVAVADVALSIGQIGIALHAALILVAVISSLISPLLFDHWAPRARDVPRHVVIAGAGRACQVLAQRLGARGLRVRVVDTRPVQLAEARAQGIESGEHPLTAGELIAQGRSWAEAGAPLTWVLPSDSDELNARLALDLRERTDEPIVAFAGDPAVAARLAEHQIQAVTPALSTLMLAENLVAQPELFHLFTGTDGEVGAAEVRLAEPAWHETPIRHIPIPHGVLLLAVARDGEHLVPNGDTRLLLGDRIALVGRKDLLDEATRLLGRR
ncbi:cation:proton antiporter domain-containing protein [Limnochorda pilosa]|uniref:Sodium:proton antiporter n=1 Tax=Limnochorda pilosa TaxID=1555112 RepID=A0A0K2SLW8_LIMPI|nr:sodium:proton antiporter [Limnochorda pilosa]